MRLGMVVVAYPLRCGDKEPVSPASIDIVPAQGAPPPRDGELATGEALARLLPGADLPAGSMARRVLARTSTAATRSRCPIRTGRAARPTRSRCP